MLKIKSFNDNKLCDCLIGVFNPFKHELPEYKRYDITKLRGYCRFAEVILNRGGQCGGIVGLFFDGVTCNWAELPRSDDYTGLNKVYSFIKSLESNVQSKSFFSYSIKRLKSLFK